MEEEAEGTPEQAIVPVEEEDRAAQTPDQNEEVIHPESEAAAVQPVDESHDTMESNNHEITINKPSSIHEAASDTNSQETSGNTLSEESKSSEEASQSLEVEPGPRDYSRWFPESDNEGEADDVDTSIIDRDEAPPKVGGLGWRVSAQIYLWSRWE